MTTFKIRPKSTDATGRYLPPAADALAKAIRGIFKAEVRIAYCGTAQMPAVSVTATLKQKSTVPIDFKAEFEAGAQLLTDAVRIAREEAPRVIGQMNTKYGANDVPERAGAAMVGHTFCVNARLGPLKRLKLWRALILACETVDSIGFTLPALPPGQNFRRFLATERRNGAVPVHFSGQLTGHQHGPRQSGLLKLWDGEELATIHTPGDSVSAVMKGYLPSRPATATVRVDRDLVFHEPRYVFADWQWLGHQPVLEALSSSSLDASMRDEEEGNLVHI